MPHASLFASFHRSGRLALGAGLLLCSASCIHTKLHESFGIRNREIFRVQTAQRTPRDVAHSGQIAESAMAKYYQNLMPSANGGGAAQGSAAMSPLKIPGMSR